MRSCDRAPLRYAIMLRWRTAVMHRCVGPMLRMLLLLSMVLAQPAAHAYAPSTVNLDTGAAAIAAPATTLCDDVVVPTRSTTGSDITILIISQKDAFNVRNAYRLRSEIREQATPLLGRLHQQQHGSHHNRNANNKRRADDAAAAGPRVYLSHEPCSGWSKDRQDHPPAAANDQVPVYGAWAITPLLAHSACRRVLLAAPMRWLVVVDAASRVNVSGLVAALRREPAHREMFLGHAMYDREPTIVHHFAHFDDPRWFPYPALRAGLVLSRPLVQNLSQRLRTPAALKLPSEFFIDAAHELAMLIWNDGRGHKLTAAPWLCAGRRKHGASTRRRRRRNCADAALLMTGADSRRASSSSVNEAAVDVADDPERGRQRRGLRELECVVYSGDESDGVDENKEPDGNVESGATRRTRLPEPVSLHSILFAVKTCSKYHADRVPIIQSTWAAEVPNVRFYSDRTDPLIPTLATGVPNTETGHCAKMLAIFAAISEELRTNGRLRTEIDWVVLADDDTLFNVAALAADLTCFRGAHDDDLYLGERYGYRLLAPDGGFNYITGGGGIVFARPLVERLAADCQCPSASSPDDMIVGMCLRQMGVEPVHSAGFHQARPQDYAAELLEQRRAISFHKFWQLDPREMWRKWLRNEDEEADEADEEADIIKMQTIAAEHQEL